MKDASFREKLSYFWDYYKWYVIGGIILIAMVVSLIRTQLNRRDSAFYVVLINFADLNAEPETLESAFLEKLGADPGEYEVNFDTTLTLHLDRLDEATNASAQKLTVMIAAKELDYAVMGEDLFRNYAYQETYKPLTDYLSAEEMAQYESEGKIFYIDRARVEEYKESLESYEPKEFLFPDPFDPESMEDPVPMALLLDESRLLKENYICVDEGQRIFGAALINAPHEDALDLFINYILP